MRNHIALKFIAVILCAAALLGVLGCGAGITLLTGMDLYDRTVDEMYQQQLNDNGLWFAHDAARRYFDLTLGTMPADFLNQEYGYTRYFDPSYTSCQLFDSQGNPLPTENASLLNIPVGPAAEGAVTYTFPAAEGKYAYLISAVAESQLEAETQPEAMDPTLDTGLITLDEADPAETAPMVMQAPDEAQSAENAPEEQLSQERSAEPASETQAEAQSETQGETQDETHETQDETQAETQGETVPEETVSNETAASDETAPTETAPAETAPAETVAPTEAPTLPAAEAVDELPPVPAAPPLINGKPLSEYQLHTGRYYDSELGDRVNITYVLLDSPACIVKLHLLPGAMEEDAYLPLLRVLQSYHRLLLPGLAVSLLLFAVFAVYLCCAAGRRPKSDEVRAGGLNRIPLELYFAAAAGAVTFTGMFIPHGLDYLLQKDLLVGVSVGMGFAYLSCLLIVGFCFAVAAQVKTPGLFWLKNSLCGLCLRGMVWPWHLLLKAIAGLARFVEKKLLPFLGWVLKGIWLGIKSVCRRALHSVQTFLNLLPLTWQWLVVCFALLLLFLLALSIGSVFLLLVALFASVATVIYSSNAFGLLLESARRMSKGDLHTKIDDRLLFGCFRDFARTLSALANVAVVAAQKQLKSERMKTELITNVSHDIKTPLTSIISYADLLQKPHTPEEEKQYLEVLSRQSMQLKKLIEDLIEMSRASTGNMTVDITQVDAVEAVNQALGEFADKLEAAMLTPVFRHSDDTAPMMADGKLVWRVLHNLLSNAVKYALPGTRLYVDMLCLEGKVILSMKNVSRDQLNIDAEELMERFVRGDGSRNTEGSGLGLNIAKSMMELQHGTLQLLVDGDLFKVTLIFPGA
ncbi:MAG: histidine kinase dimerization/phospho-acceptor domain-containing protein [Eubacteriales bacterium]|nr:histidine kinase dimerization/phospho-acceptor domain-containing protein [Eubacteriales bacterium]